MKKFLLWLGIIAGVAVGGAYLLLSLTTDEYVIDSDPIIAASVAPNLNPGDTVRIEMFDAQGKAIFGAIENTVAPLPRR